MNIKPPVRPQAHIDRLMAMLETACHTAECCRSQKAKLGI